MNAISNNRLKSFVKTDDGVTAIEYGLIAALIAVVIIGSVTLFGKELGITFNAVATAVNAAIS